MANVPFHNLHLFSGIFFLKLFETQDLPFLSNPPLGAGIASSNPGRSSRRILFSRVNFVCWLLFVVRSTPMLSQWHVKDPGHSAKSAGGRIHLNTHTSLTHRSRSGQTVPLTRQSVGIYEETSSHATRQGKLAYSRLSSLSHCGLILA